MGECLRLNQEVYVFKLYFRIGCEVSCSCTLIFLNSMIRHRVCQILGLLGSDSLSCNFFASIFFCPFFFDMFVFSSIHY